LAAGLPPTRWGSLQRSPRTLAGLRGPTSKGRGGKGVEGGEKRGVRGEWGWERKGGEGGEG